MSEQGSRGKPGASPSPSSRVNTVFGVAAVALLVITVVVVTLLAVVIYSLLRPR